MMRIRSEACGDQAPAGRCKHAAFDRLAIVHFGNRYGRYEGRVEVRFRVLLNGHVSQCAPIRGSGNAELAAITCRLVEQRLRFTPATDADGKPSRAI